MSILALPSPRAPRPCVSFGDAPRTGPNPAEQALADRLAWEADGGDPDHYPGPAWRGVRAKGFGDCPPGPRAPARFRGLRPRRQPRRRPVPGGPAWGYSDSMILGVWTPGAYWLHCWTAAAWAAIPEGERPAGALYSAMLDAYFVADLGIPWDGRTLTR